MLDVSIIVFKFELYILLMVNMFVDNGNFVFSEVCLVGDCFKFVGSM